jgi:hypothetical protein
MLLSLNTKVKKQNFRSPYQGLSSDTTLSFIDSPQSFNVVTQQAIPSPQPKKKQQFPEPAPSQNFASRQFEVLSPHYKTSHLNRLKQLLKPMLIASYKSQQEAEEIGKSYGLEFINEFSNENTFVYLDMITKFPLIVHRGSATAEDWLVSDALILTGLSRILMPRVSIAREIVSKVEERYKKPSDAFGSSLGGNIAENSNAKGFILTHNKAAGLGDLFKRNDKSRQIDYRTKKDIVSLIAETQDTNIKYLQDTGFLTSHSLNTLKEGQQDRRI